MTTPLPIDQMIDLDLRYCASMSFTLDAFIVVSTIPTLAGQFISSFCRKRNQSGDAAKSKQSEAAVSLL